MFTVAINHQGVVYVGSSQGLYRSETGDAGSWVHIFDSGSWVNFIEFGTDDPKTVFIDGYMSEKTSAIRAKLPICDLVSALFQGRF